MDMNKLATASPGEGPAGKFPSDPGGSLWGHPRGLYYLVFSEMWERFSFFGMKALLILYLIDHWRMSDGDATTMFGAYMALTYGSSLLGGILADRVFGLRRSLLLGGALIAIGNVTLAVQDGLGGTGVVVQALFTLALALIVTGTGLFKPSVATQVGALYPAEDQRREGGFYVFYMGINLGGIMAPLVCGYLGHYYGWSWGFGASAVGMTFGLLMVAAGRKYLPDPLALPATPLRTALGIVLPAMAIALGYVLLRHPNAVGPVLGIALGCALAMLFRYMATSATREERRRIVAALILIVGATAFWSLSQQAGSSLTLFAARAVDLNAGPVSLRPAQTPFLNPVFVVLLAPLFALSWRWLSRRRLEPLPPLKFVMGLALAGAGFGVLALGAHLAHDGHRVAFGWMIFAYLLITCGELCLVTPGLSTITQLAPKRVSTLMMGLWLFSLSAGNFIGAKIAGLTMSAAAGGSDPASFAGPFAKVALAAGIAACAMLLVTPILNRILGPGAARKNAG
jgi:POT family proton-dependent oligopeptide transporter